MERDAKTGEPPFADMAYDFPDWGGPTTNYLVCSIPRSGSNYLGTLLHATDGAGFPAEYALTRMQAAFARRAGLSPDDKVGIFAFIRSKRTSANGVFGAKMHFDQLVRFADGADLDRVLPGLRYIHLVRRDLLGQAISFARALQTDSFLAQVSEKAEPRFDPALIERCLQEILSLDASWRRFFAMRGLPALELVYEDVIEDPKGAVAAIGRFLGLAEPLVIRREDRIARQQRGRVNDDWRERMIELIRAEHFPMPSDWVPTVRHATVEVLTAELAFRVRRKVGI